MNRVLLVRASRCSCGKVLIVCYVPECRYYNTATEAVAKETLDTQKFQLMWKFVVYKHLETEHERSRYGDPKY